MKTIYLDSDFKCHATDNDSITFTCFEDKPTTDIPIQIEVMR